MACAGGEWGSRGRQDFKMREGGSVAAQATRTKNKVGKDALTLKNWNSIPQKRLGS